ncbi:MAG: hypothetical protein DRJ40_03370 [Thermoprotei archaeon]|nr:MAG: hypothetical protein DRJ40_03370 [Thermoprotei archaeon]
MKITKLLITLEPYTRGEESKVLTILSKLTSRSSVNFVIKPYRSTIGRRLVVELGDEVDVPKALEVAKLLKECPHVARVLVLLNEGLPVDLGHLCSRAIELLSPVVECLRPKSFKVIAKRVWSDYPLTSTEVASKLGSVVNERFSIPVDVHAPEFIVYVEVHREHAILGFSTYELYFSRWKCLPKNFFEDVVVLLENPCLELEIMDLVRLCVAYGIELRVVGKDKVREMIEKARSLMKGAGQRASISYFTSLNEALSGVDVTIALSRYARLNEEDLIKILDTCIRNGKKICFLIGNEYKGLSVEARERANYIVRLGPEHGFSLRGVAALAYTLGIYATVKLGIKPLHYGMAP